MNVLEMKCSRNLVGVSRMNRVRNEGVQRRADIVRKLASTADLRLLRWFGHVERMDEYRMIRRVLMADVSGGRVRGRPRLGCMDCMKMALGSRGMAAEAALKIGRCGEPWCICRWLSLINVAIFAWPPVLSDRPPTLSWIITGRGVGCRYMMRLA